MYFPIAHETNMNILVIETSWAIYPTHIIVLFLEKTPVLGGKFTQGYVCSRPSL